MSDSGYHLFRPEDVSAKPDRPDIDPEPDPLAETFAISAEANFETLGLRYNVVEPGEQIPLVYHYHEKQEEAFYVRSGTLRVETPEEEYVVGEGRLFAVEGGNPHRAFVPEGADEAATVVSIGAPSDDTGRSYEPDE